MKLKVALLSVLVAVLTASLAGVAVAGRQKPNVNASDTTATDTTTTTTTTGTTTTPQVRACRRIVMLVLRGKLVSVAADGTSLVMQVNRSNWQARWYKGLTVSVRVSEKTRVWLDGQSVALTALSAGDKVNVQARACWRRAQGAAPPLAIRIVASTPKPAPTTTDTTATTTTTTTTTGTTTTPQVRACRRIVMLVLRGKLVSVAADGTSLVMQVNRSNWQARWYKGLTVSVRVSGKTRVWLDGQSVALTALSAGDKVNVQARACWRRAQGAAPPLAIRIVASTPKPAPTTTDTTTATTTTTAGQ